MRNNIDLITYWNKAINYDTYLEDIQNEIEKKDSFLNYYTLNLKRMSRLNKKFALSPEQLQRINSIDKNINFLVIAEGWCGDAAQSVPILHKITQASDKLNLKLIYRDENEELINAYLTNGGKSIPIVIAIDPATGQELFHWGPRPTFGNELLKKYKNGEMTKEYFLLDLQKAYNKDNGQTIVEEILNQVK